jgi:electron transport complex protein RnfD
MKKFFMSTSPHFNSKESVASIMWRVILALLPATLWGIYRFGFCAFLTILVSIAASVLAEWIFSKMFKFELRLYDGSAFLTGLLLALTLPPATPIIVTIVGAFFAIGFGKMVFGGLGHNPFNPAFIGRAFLQASWPVYIITWKKPIQSGLNLVGIPQKMVEILTGKLPNTIDTITSATPLGALGQTLLLRNQGVITPEQFHSVENVLYSKETLLNLFFGNIGGSIGEISALLLLIGGLYLLLKKIITWHIPVVYILSVGILGWAFGGIGLFHGNFLFYILSGGLFLGAFFMATDYVTSPMYPLGKIIFAIGAGILVVVIRRFGGYPEGVCYSILIMNAFVAMLDRFTKPKPFGYLKRSAK